MSKCVTPGNSGRNCQQMGKIRWCQRGRMTLTLALFKLLILLHVEPETPIVITAAKATAAKELGTWEVKNSSTPSWHKIWIRSSQRGYTLKSSVGLLQVQMLNGILKEQLKSSNYNEHLCWLSLY